jgi:predicted DNA-binding transcriptional regulator AlpA
MHWTERTIADVSEDLYRDRVARGIALSKASNVANRDAARKLRLIRREASPYITISEFADLFKVARSTIDRLRKRRPAGFPTEYAPAGRVRFKRQEVLAWIEAQPLW